jgi:surface polysaccharide O-acyltransferase-like enzyme
LEEVFNIELMGLSTIGAWGSQQGFTLTNFVFMYIVGGYLRFGIDDSRLSNRKIMMFLCVDVFMLFGWSLICEFLSQHGLRSAWCYHNPLVIIEAVCIFVLFKRVRISKNWINEMAKGAFTCYLVHYSFLRLVNIEKYVTGNAWAMLVQIVLLQVTIYVISYVIYKIYDICTKPLMSKVGKIVNQLDISADIEKL